MKTKEKHTFIADNTGKIHAYQGDSENSKRTKIYIKRIGKSTFIIEGEETKNCVLSFFGLIEYINEIANIENEIIVRNLSRANVGAILKLCNENKERENQETDHNHSQALAIEIANRRLIELFGITYEEFSNLTCLEQNELMEIIYAKKEEKDTNKVMIESGDNALFIKKKLDEKVMLADGTFVKVGDNPYQSRKRIDEKLDEMVNEKESFVRKLIKKVGRK